MRCFTSWWHRFNKVPEPFQRFWSISLSAAHPWYQAPIPLRPKCAILDWDLWRLFEYIVMSKKHIWNYLSFATFFCWKQPSVDWYADRRRSATTLFKQCLLCTEGPKVWQENIPQIIVRQAAWTVDTQQGGLAGFKLYVPNSDPTIPMLQQKSRLIRPGSVFPIVSKYCAHDPMWNVASVSCH